MLYVSCHHEGYCYAREISCQSNIIIINIIKTIVLKLHKSTRTDIDSACLNPSTSTHYSNLIRYCRHFHSKFAGSLALLDMFSFSSFAHAPDCAGVYTVIEHDCPSLHILFVMWRCLMSSPRQRLLGHNEGDTAEQGRGVVHEASLTTTADTRRKKPKIKPQIKPDVPVQRRPQRESARTPPPTEPHEGHTLSPTRALRTDGRWGGARGAAVEGRRGAGKLLQSMQVRKAYTENTPSTMAPAKAYRNGTTSIVTHEIVVIVSIISLGAATLTFPSSMPTPSCVSAPLNIQYALCSTPSISLAFAAPV
jgi:hypothetical protein